MRLPYFIEYLLTLQQSGGGRLLHVGVAQTIVPAFPPLTTLNYQSTPSGRNYAAIWYRSVYSNAMIPDVFVGWAQQYGATIMTGTITQLAINEGADVHIVVTRAEPFIAQITNTSNLTQYYEGATEFLNVATKEDLDLLISKLKELRASYLTNLAGPAERTAEGEAEAVPHWLTRWLDALVRGKEKQ